MFDKFKEIPALILVTDIAIGAFSLSFVQLNFLNQGFSLYQILLIWFILSFTGAVSTVFTKNYDTRRFMVIGRIIIISLFASLLIKGWTSLVLFGFLWGLTIPFFWVTLNYLFFETTKKTHHARHSAIYYFAAPILAAILPPLGGLFAKQFGFQFLFFVGMLLSFIPFIFTKKLTSKKKKINLSHAFSSFKNLKTITLIEGASHWFMRVIIPLYSLLFLEDVVELGIFLGIVGLATVFGMVVVSRISDKLKKRLFILTPLFVILATLCFILPRTTNIVTYAIVVSLFTFFNRISEPIKLAVLLDHKKTDLEFWYMRDILLSFGRFFYIGIAVIFFYLGVPQFAFFLFGILFLSYIGLVWYKLES